MHVGGVTIDKASARTVREAQQFFADLQLTEKEAAIADKVLKEIRRRLGFLRDVGLDYLTLDRLSSTLSGGEAQRINLATSLGSALVGTLYVLDEPSIGLHTRDNERLIAILRQLRDQGNTVIVVEHDADMIAVADHLVDMGLGAGEHGGRVVFSGTLEGLHAGAALADREVPARRAEHPGAGGPPQGLAAAHPAVRRERAQPQGRRHRDPAQHADVRDRRERLGQVDARARRALRRDQAGEGRLGSQGRRAPAPRRPRVRQRRRAGRSDADRPHAAIESGHLPQGLRSDPRAVCRDQGREVARPDREPFLVQRARADAARPARARAKCASRCSFLPTCSCRASSATAAASSAGARRPLSRQEHHAGARPDRARGADVLQPARRR